MLILKAGEDLSCRNDHAETQTDFLSKIAFQFVASPNHVGNVVGREKHAVELSSQRVTGTAAFLQVAHHEFHKYTVS